MNHLSGGLNKDCWGALSKASQSAVETADRIGIRRERAAIYRQTQEGYEACYASMSEFVTMKRSAAPCEAMDSWKKQLEENDDGK